MPKYDYHCAANNRVVEVVHGMDDELQCWGEVCFVAQIPLGDTAFEAPVTKRLHAPYVHTPTGHSDLKSLGFTKLVKRDAGVYENVTALDHEQRYMKANDPGSLPDLKRKIGD